MIALAVSIVALLFALFTLWVVWRNESLLCCPECARFRPRRDADGWRHCEECKTGWKVEAA